MSYIGVILLLFVINVTSFKPLMIKELGISADITGIAVTTNQYTTSVIALGINPDFIMMRKVVDSNPGITSKCRALSDKNFQLQESYMTLMNDLKHAFPLEPGSITSTHLCIHDFDFCQRSSRQKRFLPLLGVVAGLIGTGLGLYNTISSSQLSSAIATLRKHQEYISSKMANHENRLHVLEETDHDLIIFAHHMSASMLKMEDMIKCNKLQLELDFKFSEQWFGVMRSSIIRAAESLNRGELTPDLISYNKVSTLVTEKEELRQSPYREDPGLFYRLSSTLPITITSDGILYFIISTPIIAEHNISPVITISNAGWIFKQQHNKINLPEYITIDRDNKGNEYPIELKRSQCKETPGIWLCHGSDKFSHSASSCLKNLITNGQNSSDCTILTRYTLNTNEVITTPSGVWVINATNSIKVMKLENNRITSTSLFEKSIQGSTFVPYSDFSILTIGDTTVHSMPSVAKNYTIYSINFSIPEYSEDLLSDIWTDLKTLDIQDAKLKNREEDHWYVFPKNSDIYIWTPLFISIIVIIAILLTCYCCRKKTVRVAKRKTESVRMSALKDPDYFQPK